MMHALKFQLIFSLVCLLGNISFPAIAQRDIDTLRIRQWIDSARDILYDEPEIARKLAYKAIDTSQNKYYFGKLNGLQLIGEYYYFTGQPDSAIFFYKKALASSQQAKDQVENGHNYTALASVSMEAGARDSALYYFEIAIRTFEKLRDSSNLCDALLRYGNVHNSMGHHDLAMESYISSIRICEAIHNDQYVGYNYGSIASVHDKQGDFQKAEEYFFKALDVFRRSNDAYGQMSVYNNLGIMYKNMKKYQKSLDAYSQSLVFADSIQFDRGKMSAHTNLGILNVHMGLFENALHHSMLGLQLSKDLQVKETVADNLNWIARAQMGLHDYDNAIRNAEEALVISKEVQSLEKQRDVNLTLSEIYQARHVFDRSLEYFKAYSEAKDSLFNADRSKQISELQTVYETEKKDKEIQLLAKNAELDRAKKIRLWIALGLSLLAGSLLIHNQWIRRTRDRKILSQEKELEIQRRQTAELEAEKMSRELDFKKQELAAKALQLARKNEFLQSLHEEVEKMQAHVQGIASDSARKISRHIRMDIESENDWEQFLNSFREVHRDFMDGLHRAYPDLSKSEMRLACLMKMNLSAKEQAALLNVTPDGIKKARYRLRKTMNLDSEVDIQEFMLGFKG